MKSFLLVTLAFIGFSASAECPDFSGAYTCHHTAPKGAAPSKLTVTQTEDLIAWVAGEKEEAVSGPFMLVGETHDRALGLPVVYSVRCTPATMYIVGKTGIVGETIILDIALKKTVEGLKTQVLSQQGLQESVCMKSDLLTHKN